MSNAPPARFTKPPSRPPTRRSIGPTIAAVVTGLVLLALATGPLSSLFDSPSFVERMSFVNPTEYHLSIEATDAERHGWVPVTTARKGSSTVVEETIDQGDVWIFRFSGQGRQAGEIQRTRAELIEAKWTVQIPDSIGAALRAKGAPPSP